jgi:hypothetical protein
VPSRSIVRVLEHDPDLARHLTPEDFNDAREQLIACVVAIPPATGRSAQTISTARKGSLCC